LVFSSNQPKAPWLAWGPYLWADGRKPRSDGLIWECTDFISDGTHPSDAGRTKVAQLLLSFFKTDSTATIWFLKNPATGIAAAPGHPPKLFYLEQNFPNPFGSGATSSAHSGGNPATTIRFSLAQREQVTLKLYDLAGREIAILIDGELDAGEHRIAFKATELPSGVYLYRMATPAFSQTRKALLLR
jgi:hypothetical protein